MRISIILFTVSLLFINDSQARAQQYTQPEKGGYPRKALSSMFKEQDQDGMINWQDGDTAFTTTKWQGGVEAQAGYMDGVVPFWFRANNGGNIPIANGSLSFLANGYKEYTKRKGVDWGGGVLARLNLGKQKELHLIEAYGKARWSVFQVKAGLFREFKGLVDSSLSSGSLAVSGNARPFPTIQVSIPNYVHIPILGRIISIKGSVEHGWMGSIPVNYVRNAFQFNRVSAAVSYLHHKAFYGRLGKPTGTFFFTAGVNHQVMWGDERRIFGPEFHLKPFENFVQIFVGGKKNTSRNISKIGNQLGTLDFGLDIETKDAQVSFYRQFIYDKGAIAYLANVRDGLTGVSFQNKKLDHGAARISKLLFEVLYTRNQAGEMWSKKTPSGPEQYYNHGIYPEGYSYKQLGLGTPFITEKRFARTGQASSPGDFFINNRIFLFHVGVEGQLRKWNYKALGSFSNNYGTFWTSNISSYWFNGKRRPFNAYHGIFQKVNQSSFFIEMSRQIIHGATVSVACGIDAGKLLNNTTGVAVSFKKQFYSK